MLNVFSDRMASYEHSSVFISFTKQNTITKRKRPRWARAARYYRWDRFLEANPARACDEAPVQAKRPPLNAYRNFIKIRTEGVCPPPTLTELAAIWGSLSMEEQMSWTPPENALANDIGRGALPRRGSRTMPQTATHCELGDHIWPLTVDELGDAASHIQKADLQWKPSSPTLSPRRTHCRRRTNDYCVLVITALASVLATWAKLSLISMSTSLRNSGQ